MKAQMNKYLFLIFTATFFSISTQSFAQSEVTFNVNLKPQLEDSIFVPGRDVAELIGDTYPLRRTRGLKLEDTAPVDSIYSVTVDFPRRYSGEKLSFNFVLKTENKTHVESMPRELQLRNGEFDLNALYFDSFAW